MTCSGLLRGKNLLQLGALTISDESVLASNSIVEPATDSGQAHLPFPFPLALGIEPLWSETKEVNDSLGEAFQLSEGVQIIPRARQAGVLIHP